MMLRLTHTGLRYVAERSEWLVFERGRCGADVCLLEEVRERLLRPYEGSSLQKELVGRGFLELVGDETELAETLERYRHNPLENVHTINFEMTTKCNLSCLHCRSGIVKRTTGTDIESLKSSVDLFLSLGITSYTFIGGEVSKYGDGWLELVAYIRERYEEEKDRIPSRHWGRLRIALLTSGWWLEEEGFVAAGVKVRDDVAYMEALSAAGLTDLIFSVDGPEELHDRWRRVPGLYQRIMRGLSRVRGFGLLPKVSLVVLSSEHKAHTASYIAQIAELLYDFSAKAKVESKIEVLLNDPANFVSQFIDINNGVQLSQGRYHLSDIDASILRCKAFFRPSPKLSISSSGELAICPLMNAGEKYGNIHKRPLVEILNTLHENFIFRQHAEKKIASYLPMMDREIFGERFDHVCSLRTIVNLLARKMDERGLLPEAVTEADAPALLEINREVARWTGHLKSRGSRTVGRI